MEGRDVVDSVAEQSEEVPNDDENGHENLPSDEPDASDSEGSRDVSGDEENDEEDEEEDDDDDFLVREGEEDDEEDAQGDENEEGEEAHKKRRKKKRRHRELVLEEEDYELVEEHTGIRHARHQSHRRLKRAREVVQEPGEQHKTAAEQLRAELFGPAADDTLEDDLEDKDVEAVKEGVRGADNEEGNVAPGYGGDDQRVQKSMASHQTGEGDRAAAEIDDDDFFDDEDDFIVNEFEDEETAAAARAARRRRRKAAIEGLPGIDPFALEEANDIFGGLDELMQRYESRPKAAGGRGDGGFDENVGRQRAMGAVAAEEEEDEEDEYGIALGEDETDESDVDFGEETYGDVGEFGLEDDDLRGGLGEQDHSQRQLQRRRRRASLKAIKHLEPAAIERNFLTKRDQRVKKGDLPEREQLGWIRAPVDFDLEACAAWIWKELVSETAPPSKPKDTIEEGVREVDGPPPEWMHLQNWPSVDLRGRLDDTSSHRGLYQGRLAGGREAVRAWLQNEEAQKALRESIVLVLEHLYVHHEEVPVIGMFRKELAGELLALRHRDEPLWVEEMRREFEMREEQNRRNREAGIPEVQYEYLGALRPQERRARRWDILYAVFRLAERWKVFQRRRELVASSLRRAMDAADAAVANEAATKNTASVLFARDCLSQCLSALALAQSFEDMSDIDVKCKLAVDALTEGIGADDAGMAEEALAALKLSNSQPHGDAGAQRQRQKEAVDREQMKVATEMTAALQREEEGGVEGEDAEGAHPLEDLSAYVGGESSQRAKDSMAQDGGGEVPKAEGKSPSVLARRRRPQRLLAHRVALRVGLSDVAKQIGISPIEFAENIEEGIAIHEPDDPSTPPGEFVAQWVDASVPARRDASSILQSAKSLAIANLASEPAVRNPIRQYFNMNAVVSTSPTAAGDTVLNPFHPLGIAKRLRNKPLTSFDGTDTFLRVLAAEKEGLITVTIGFPKEKAAVDEATGMETQVDDLQAYLEQLQNLYLSSDTSENAQAWNEVRSSILTEAVENHILPDLIQEVRGRLNVDAASSLSEKLSSRLWEYASVSPLQLEVLDSRGDSTGEIVAEPRIMAAVWGPSIKAPTTFVMLDSHGTMIDFLQCPQFSGSIPRGKAFPGVPYRIFEDPKKSRDAIRIREFLESHLPNALLLGVGYPEALALHDDLALIHEHIVDENPRAFASNENGDLAKYLVDEAIAVVWEHSEAAREELPSSHPLIRRAVALARQALDPLAVLTSLAGRSREILSLQLHPLQHSIPEDQRWRAIEDVLVSATSQAGVDLNAAIATPWIGAPLPFVPGLGPRKSKAMLRALLRSGGVVHSRKQILRELSGCIGPVVFKNAAPFLRVRPSSRAARNLEIDLLDDTRIHVESYDHAVAIAMSAAGDVDEEVAIESAMARPEDVAVLELAQYDAHLQKEGAGARSEHGGDASEARKTPQTKLSTLIDIQFELIAPYGEIRRPFAVLRAEDAFWIAVGDRDGYKGEWHVFKKGRRVEAKVRWVGEELVRCSLSEFSGLDVVIAREHVSSKLPPEEINCRNYFNVGETIIAVIVEINPSTRTVSLATDSLSLNADLDWEDFYFRQEAREKYYLIPDKKEIEKAEREKRRVAQLPFIPRFIQHPLFRNISMADAAQEISQSPVGTTIVRPASRSPNKLYLSMHIPGCLVWHIEIKEMGPTAQNLRLAPPLQISLSDTKKYVYDDLDELAARFVDPVSAMMQALAHHRKWRGTVTSPDGQQMARPWNFGEQSMRSVLIDDKRRNPAVVAYGLAADVDSPGLFYIGRIIGSTPRRERFSVLPTGFYFREMEFEHLDKMLGAFRKDPQYLEKLESSGHGASRQSESQDVFAAGSNGRPGYGRFEPPMPPPGGVPGPVHPSYGSAMPVPQQAMAPMAPASGSYGPYGPDMGDNVPYMYPPGAYPGPGGHRMEPLGTRPAMPPPTDQYKPVTHHGGNERWYDRPPAPMDRGYGMPDAPPYYSHRHPQDDGGRDAHGGRRRSYPPSYRNSYGSRRH